MPVDRSSALTPAEKKRFSAEARALFGIESSGGHWITTGPVTQSGDRAYGVSQVMGVNVPGWTAKYYGRQLTPQEYLRNKEAQIKVTNGVTGEYFQKALRAARGNRDIAIRMMAASWFGGEGNRNNYDSTTISDGYTTMRDYTNNVLGEYKRIVAQGGASSDETTGTEDNSFKVPSSEKVALGLVGPALAEPLVEASAALGLPLGLVAPTLIAFSATAGGVFVLSKFIEFVARRSVNPQLRDRAREHIARGTRGGVEGRKPTPEKVPGKDDETKKIPGPPYGPPPRKSKNDKDKRDEPDKPHQIPTPGGGKMYWPKGRPIK